MDIKVDSSTVVCFDLDDTLYNEIDYLKSAYIAIAQNLSKDHWRPLYTKMLSLYRNREDVFVFLTNTYPSFTKDMLLDMYRNHLPHIKLFPGVLLLFKAIKSAGGRLAVITDGRSCTQRNKLKSLGLLSYLDTVVISGEIGTEKPHEENFIVIEEHFKTKSYYYIGDNFKKDFVAPNKRGWISIGLIDNGLNIHNHANEFLNTARAPHHLIISLKDLNVIG